MDLRPIMVLRRQPKDRNTIDASFRGLLGELHRMQRFINGKYRPAKKSDLLPRYNGKRPLEQAVNVLYRFCRRSPCMVLPSE